MHTSTALYRHHRFPSEIISHTVWVYFRFALSFRDVEEILAVRGVTLSYEAIREWCLKFGQTYANGLRRRRPRPGDKWHLDEMFIKINGKDHYLWRAVDQDGHVLVAQVVTRFKRLSARAVFREFPQLKRKLWGGEFWENGYFARTVGDKVTAEMIRKYIQLHKEAKDSQLDLFGQSTRKPRQLAAAILYFHTKVLSVMIAFLGTTMMPSRMK